MVLWTARAPKPIRVYFVCRLPATWLVARSQSFGRSGSGWVTLCDMDGSAVSADLRVRPLPRGDGSVAWALFDGTATGAVFWVRAGQVWH
ncbi:hypothetical protein GCM10011578_019640 [Streptomyces fuscichromogenes]|uniref:Uncharacterized protein n=1 Tax=Streptomyces fuscichromogenes TaxID=1324013 RepID=A0A918CPW4_9ACTN|nr:hypothetical protein GCM10011578_019640 [Streptomyces fuscichromogenes]